MQVTSVTLDKNTWRPYEKTVYCFLGNHDAINSDGGSMY
jgi:hypothetical protein